MKEVFYFKLIFMKSNLLLCFMSVLLTLISCKKQTNAPIQEQGFIIFNDFNSYFFVPILKKSGQCPKIKNINKEGFQFHITSNEIYKQVISNADTIKDEYVDSTFSVDYQYLKILPVNIKYSIVEVIDTNRLLFESRVTNTILSFYYKHYNIDIGRIDIIKCNK